MNYFKISIGIFIVLATSRFVPHPPNFTSLIALSLYVPIVFGLQSILVVVAAFFVTDLVIGFHSLLFFTWGSVVLIGFLFQLSQLYHRLDYKILICLLILCLYILLFLLCPLSFSIYYQRLFVFAPYLQFTKYINSLFLTFTHHREQNSMS